MGLELHITRAEFWASNQEAQITLSEWTEYVVTDTELKPKPEFGEGFVLWLGESAYPESWLDWFQGNISTKWPDTTLYKKMLEIAATLGAQVQDDDGTVYTKPTDWDFNPDRM